MRLRRASWALESVGGLAAAGRAWSNYNSQETARWAGQGSGRGIDWLGLSAQRQSQRKMASRRLRSFLRGLPALLLLLLFLLGPWPAASHGGKYSREKNQPEPPPKRESGEEFRMEKLNQLWEKAQRVSATRGRRP